MTRIALPDAQRQLAELVAAVRRGEEFVITVEGAAAAIVTAPKEDADTPRPRFGSARGEFDMSDDFDDPLEEYAEYP